MNYTYKIKKEKLVNFYNLEPGECFFLFRDNGEPLFAVKIEETEKGSNALDLGNNRVFCLGIHDFVKPVHVDITIEEE